jgi:hypothetical protein
MSLADEPQLRACVIRRAIRRPEYFLAAEISADPAKVYQLRLCGWPRQDAWAADVRQLAAVVGGDATRLGRLLVEVGGPR